MWEACWQTHLISRETTPECEIILLAFEDHLSTSVPFTLMCVKMEFSHSKRKVKNTLQANYCTNNIRKHRRDVSKSPHKTRWCPGPVVAEMPRLPTSDYFNLIWVQQCDRLQRVRVPLRPSGTLRWKMTWHSINTLKPPWAIACMKASRAEEPW